MLAFVHVVAVVAVATAFAGVGWILALATLNSTYQSLLPGWVKARAIAYYLIVIQGGTAVGSALLGVLAGPAGVSAVLAGAAVMLVLGPVATSRRPIPAITPDELMPAGDWPVAHARGAGDDPSAGPVMVTVRRRAKRGRETALAQAVLGLRLMRRRTGASEWSAWTDPQGPPLVLEQFVVASWEDHERQMQRMTVRDRNRLSAVSEMADDVAVTHWRQVSPAGA